MTVALGVLLFGPAFRGAFVPVMVLRGVLAGIIALVMLPVRLDVATH